MGLLDKAKEKQQEEEGSPEPEVKEEPEVAEKKKAPPKKKTKKSAKKEEEAPVKKKAKKPGLKKSSVGAKKKAPPKKKKAAKPKKEKAPKEPAEPDIEGLPEDLEFASIKSRLIAQVIDGLLLGIVWFILFVVLLLTLEDVGLIPAIILGFVLPIAYYAMMEGNSGKTVGKGMAHVRVISLDGKPLTPGRVFKSALAKGLFFPIVNILDAAFGILVQHKDTLQRYTQYETDLIVITVPKKKVKFGYAMDEDDEGSNEEEAGEEAPAEETADEK
jgi:uncharacterized RDD family membrane protein YckC